MRQWRLANPQKAAALSHKHSHGTRMTWLRKNLDKVNAQRRAKSRQDTLKGYDLTPEEFDRLLAAQDGRCAICQKDNPPPCMGQKWAVDHDHVTGEVRGVLCHMCNRGLGQFEDCMWLLKAAFEYLRKAKV